jgi:hypothetical protein
VERWRNKPATMAKAHDEECGSFGAGVAVRLLPLPLGEGGVRENSDKTPQSSPLQGEEARIGRRSKRAAPHDQSTLVETLGSVTRVAVAVGPASLRKSPQLRNLAEARCASRTILRPLGNIVFDECGKHTGRIAPPRAWS